MDFWKKSIFVLLIRANQEAQRWHKPNILRAVLAVICLGSCVIWMKIRTGMEGERDRLMEGTERADLESGLLLLCILYMEKVLM